MNKISNEKNVAMIPVRMGSKRVKSKNIRMINGKPLVFYILDSVIKSGCFPLQDIYINSEDIIFESISKKLGISFYHRDPKLSSDSATNDDFLFDFLKKVDCDNVFQFLSTSPLVKCQTISQFVDSHLRSKFNTTISVKEIRIECLFNTKSINFSPTKQTPPSQDLEPIYAYACGLMAWNRADYIRNFTHYNGAAYHGGNSKPNLFTLSELESVDIDTEEDFIIAESLLNNQFRNEQKDYGSSEKTIYWDPSIAI